MARVMLHHSYTGLALGARSTERRAQWPECQPTFREGGADMTVLRMFALALAITTLTVGPALAHGGGGGGGGGGRVGGGGGVGGVGPGAGGRAGWGGGWEGHTAGRGGGDARGAAPGAH